MINLVSEKITITTGPYFGDFFYGIPSWIQLIILLIYVVVSYVISDRVFSSKYPTQTDQKTHSNLEAQR